MLFFLSRGIKSMKKIYQSGLFGVYPLCLHIKMSIITDTSTPYQRKKGKNVALLYNQNLIHSMYISIFLQ